MLYRLILKARHSAYDKGRKESLKAALPTICVGNVTVGGTGKTPHTELLLRLLEGRNAAVLSRGYRRKTKGYLDVDPTGSAEQFGDEPLQIAGKFPGTMVAVDEDRIEGCEKLAQKGAGLVILDDAFQYRRLKADLNIVLVDYNRPIFKDKLLPFGSLRDLPERALCADMIIVTKCPAYMGESDKADFAAALKLSDYHDCSALTPDGRRVDLLFSHIVYMEPQMAFPQGDHRFTYADRVVIISGVAKNSTLKRYLSEKYLVEKMFSFPDHHAFSAKDMKSFEKALDQYPTSAFATTEKDLARLRSCEGLPEKIKERLFAVPIEAMMLSEDETARLVSRIESLR